MKRHPEEFQVRPHDNTARNLNAALPVAEFGPAAISIGDDKEAGSYCGYNLILEFCRSGRGLGKESLRNGFVAVSSGIVGRYLVSR